MAQTACARDSGCRVEGHHSPTSSLALPLGRSGYSVSLWRHWPPRGLHVSPRNPSWRQWAGRAALEDRPVAGQPRRPVTERASGAAAGSSLLPFYRGRGPALSKDRCPSSDSPQTEGTGVRGGAASRGHVPQGRRACPGTRTLPMATRLCQHVALVKVPLSDRRLVPCVQIDRRHHLLASTDRGPADPLQI